jgi:hypothetical protein
MSLMMEDNKFSKYLKKSLTDSNVNKKLERFSRVIEALDIRRKGAGEVPFKNTTLMDRHIQEIVKRVSTQTGVPAELITAEMQKGMEQIAKLKNISPMLYDTLAKNEAENSAFGQIQKSEKLTQKQHFDVAVFYKLIKMIQEEHAQFFPLRAPGEKKYIFGFSPILVPVNPKRKPELAKFNQVDTAAATANGEFIFNVPFMEKLMDFAEIEELKPEGKKYECNGGTIPDVYGYIEFVVMHELLHYSYGDFTSGDRYKGFTHKEHNWASDFRSNYMLVKSGYCQLPIGLFSDAINMDRQHSYYELVKTVHDELEKVRKANPELAKNIEQQMDDSTDDHGEQEGEPGDKPGEPGDKPGDQPGDGAEKSGEKPGDKPGQGDVNDPDKVHKDIEDKLKKRKEKGGNDSGTDRAGEGGSGEGGGRNGGGLGRQGAAPELKKIEIPQTPKFNWKSLLSKCVTASVPHIDTSYAKPSRRSVTSVFTGAQIGAAAIKPGENNVEEPKNKLVFVFDTSGSMGYAIPTVLAETQNLLKKHGQSIDAVVGIAFFTEGVSYYEVNIGKDYYAEITDFSKLGKSEAKKRIKGYKKVFSMASSGGTVLSSELTAQLSSTAGQGYNVMLFSDSDLTTGINFTNLSNLYNKHRSNIFFIADSKETYLMMCRQMGSSPKTFSHF